MIEKYEEAIYRKNTNNKQVYTKIQAIRETQIKNNETTIFFYLIDKILNGW